MLRCQDVSSNMQIEPVFRALADPTRLRILRLLDQMELAVGELAIVLGQSQPRVSRHVGILCDAGLAERRHEGSWVFLRQRIAVTSPDGFVSAMARMLAATEDSDAAFAARCEEDRRHLAAVRKSRERAAAEYFERHAGDWDRIRAMNSPADQVNQALLQQFGDDALGRLLDVGTGTGQIAELLAPNASHVVAFDKSPEMLRLARVRLQPQPGQNLELVQGDFAAMPFEEGAFDTVVFHQVLHYAHDPLTALQEAARVCRPGARLAIVDLAAHQREELRQRHSHIRLGFSDEQMLGFLSDSGFDAASPMAVPGRELTTKIWMAVRRATRLQPLRKLKQTAEHD